jgi:hypothetical protein
MSQLLFCQGRSYAAIARALGLHRTTAARYVTRLHQQVQADRRADRALALALSRALSRALDAVQALQAATWDALATEAAREDLYTLAVVAGQSSVPPPYRTQRARLLSVLLAAIREAARLELLYDRDAPARLADKDDAQRTVHLIIERVGDPDLDPLHPEDTPSDAPPVAAAPVPSTASATPPADTRPSPGPAARPEAPSDRFLPAHAASSGAGTVVGASVAAAAAAPTAAASPIAASLSEWPRTTTAPHPPVRRHVRAARGAPDGPAYPWPVAGTLTQPFAPATDPRARIPHTPFRSALVSWEAPLAPPPMRPIRSLTQYGADPTPAAAALLPLAVSAPSSGLAAGPSRRVLAPPPRSPMSILRHLAARLPSLLALAGTLMPPEMPRHDTDLTGRGNTLGLHRG